MTLTPRLKENALQQIESLTGDQELELFERLLELVWELADNRETAGDYEKKTEAFAMDDETFDGTLIKPSITLLIGMLRSIVTPIPISPENRPIINVSALNTLEISFFEAPMLRRIPISFVLSRTEI